jgi:hypothetical protein
MMSVFLSSTFRDFDEYRTDVSEALADAGGNAIRLENAAGAYVDTVEVCEREFRQADAFLLMLAHWYGSIPNAGSKSVTHMEFDWAWQRWANQKRRPMAVLMPQDGSQADLELKAKTEALLGCASPEYRKAHPEWLANFRNQVTGNWQRVNFFPTRERAARKAIVAYFHWKEQTPISAALGPGRVLNDDVCSPDSLGCLGRQTQLDAFHREIARLKLNAAAPGAAFLVSGDELAGQAEFLAHVLRGNLISRPHRPAKIASLPSSDYDADKLAGWAGEQLGFSGVDRAESVADLARKIANELQTQSLTLALQSLEHLAGGAEAFQQQFWKPLYDELAELKARRPFKHRLLALAAAWEESQDPRAGSLGYDGIVVLPELGEITADHVALWLEEQQVAEEQRISVVTQVMKGKQAIPARTAFERLKRQNLQREEGEFN